MRHAHVPRLRAGGTLDSSSDARDLAMLTTASPAAGKVLALTPAIAQAGPNSHMWFVNICRPSCGFCMALIPAWEELARRLRHEVVVAYWDSFAYPVLAPELGVGNYTPILRAVIPSGRSLGDVQFAAATAAAAPTVPPPPPLRLVDYDGPRSVAAMAEFAGALMPSLVKVVDSRAAWDALTAAAAADGVPLMLVFSSRRASAASAPPVLKALSTTYGGALTVVEVRVHATAPETAAIAARFGVRELPAALALRSVSAVDDDATAAVRHDGPPTFRRLMRFIEKALGLRTSTSTSASTSAPAGEGEPVSPSASARADGESSAPAGGPEMKEEL